VRVIHTPGHTPGSVCYLAEEMIFTGDTLFAGSIGRTDLPGGSLQSLLSSISAKILSLPDHYAVYPGHGPSSTIGAEKMLNPFLRFMRDR
ncbi:MAG: MBL fold metallo-hydrolase, partial [Nitrososphaerota archaeon]